MPAHSFLKSAAQGLPACATAAEPDSSSAVSMTNPDRIPATLDFLHEDSKMHIRIYPKAGFSPRHGKPTVLQRATILNLKDRGCEAFCAMCSMKNDRLARGVSLGSEAVRLRPSKCFPVCASKQTQGVY